jgi:hypothetical protein
MSTVICPKCKGLRKILGLGMLERDCDKCNKTGRIAAESVAVKAPQETVLRDDLRTLSDAYTDSQAENEALKAQLATLTARPVNSKKSSRKSK